MKLLFTLTAYPPFIGGAQLLMHQLARELCPRHPTQVVTQWDERRTDWLLGTTINSPDSARAYVIDGVPVRRIALSSSARRNLLFPAMAYYALPGLALPQIAKALETEVAPFAADIDLIHNCRIGREGLSYASLNIARKRGIPFIFTPVHHPGWGGWLYRYYHALYRQADAVIALTEAERQTLIALGVNERRITVTGMGPIVAENHDSARFRMQYNLGADLLVLFLGQKYSYKGIKILLEVAQLVWRRLPEARFAFVGPRTRYSRRLFKNIDDRRIIELDVVSLQEKTDALAACDVFCLPSSQESFGGVFTEAWSLGKPVIGCDIPAVRSVIDDGQDGFLTKPSPGPIAERLIYLLERPDLRVQMGRQGQEKVNVRYTWSWLADETEQVYRRVLKGGM